MAAPQAQGNPRAHTVPLPLGSGTDFKYACTLNMPQGVGKSATGEILINPHYDFVIRRVTWDYHAPALPKVRITWKDNRRSYLDKKAMITAVFGNPGDDFPFTSGVLIDRGTTLMFEADSLDDNEGSIDIVLHGVELRHQGEG